MSDPPPLGPVAAPLLGWSGTNWIPVTLDPKTTLLNAASTLSARPPGGTIRINGVGDSQFGGQSVSMQHEAYSYIPTRVAGAVVNFGELYQDNGRSYRVTTAGILASGGPGALSRSIASLSNVVGGTAYTTGVYPAVPLTGGTGSAAQATIVVAGGAVTGVTLTLAGRDYTTGDVLSAASASIGGTGAGFAVTANYVGSGMVIQDGTAVFTFISSQSIACSTSPLTWLEAFSLGRFRWTFDAGYDGPSYGAVAQVFVLPGNGVGSTGANGGTGYATGDAWSAGNGANGLLTIVGGVVVGATITNPGSQVNVSAYTITSSTGTGCRLGFVVSGSGAFACSGSTTESMQKYVVDAVASGVDALLFFGLTNDISWYVSNTATAIAAYPGMVSRWRAVVEYAMDNGVKMLPITVSPRVTFTAAQAECARRLNRFMRAYCNGEAWANPLGYTQIALVDPSRYSTDGTSTAASPIPVGGMGGVNGAMTQDGLHESQRLAQYIARLALVAASRWFGSGELSISRNADAAGGYDYLGNPSGNMLEALGWTRGETITSVNQTRSANGNVYYATQAGTCSVTGSGPAGTGGGQSDGTVRWNYSRPKGCSVLASAAVAFTTPIGLVATAGNLPNGYLLGRSSGSAAGTVTASIESPWSDGQIGQRLKLRFSLLGGTTSEIWRLQLNAFGLRSFGMLAADQGVLKLRAEMEIEVAGVKKLNSVRLLFSDPSTQITTEVGTVLATGQASSTLMDSSGEMLSYPNGGKMNLATPPFLIPGASFSSPVVTLYVAFDASSTTAPAELELAINHVALHRTDLG